MKEIEVKVKLKDLNQIVFKLEKLGCVLSESERQIDTVYVINTGDVDEYINNDHFLRIREKSDGKFIFTVKKPLSREVLTKIEHETEVKNAKELEQALFLMGYQMSNRVIKSRRTANYNQLEICVDEVEELGLFLEVEIISNDEAKARNEIQEFLTLLDVSKSDEVHKGYDIMMVEKHPNP